MLRQKIMQQKTAERQWHDLLVERLIFQLKLADDENEQAELKRNAEKLACARPIKLGGGLVLRRHHLLP